MISLGLRIQICPRNMVRRNILRTTSLPQLSSLNHAFLGDIIYLRSFSKVIVVLSSCSAIKDLLEKRGEYYSDRASKHQ